MILQQNQIMWNTAWDVENIYSDWENAKWENSFLFEIINYLEFEKD